MLIETLERRELMTATPASCMVTCPTGNDAIVCTSINGKLNVSVNGVVKANVDLKLVSSLVLNTSGGKDAISVVGVDLPVCVKVGANVFANVAPIVGGGTVFVNTGISANVLAKLGLSAGLKLNAGASVDAAVGLLANLKIGVNGALCFTAGVKVDAQACLGLLDHLGVKTGAAINLSTCVSLCSTLGIKPLISLGAAVSVNTQLNSCVEQLASVGVKLDLDLSLGGLLSLHL